MALSEDEAFQVIFSALGSTMTSKSTVSSSGPMDVVLVLDNSASMATASSGSTTRLQQTVEAANALIADLLTIQNVRLSIVTYGSTSTTILPLASYTNGVTLKVNDYAQTSGGNWPSSSSGQITAYDDDNTAIGASSAGYETATNLQSGISTGMDILNNATDVSGRSPVMIVLTDGRADKAVNTSYYDVDSGTYRQPSSNDVTTGVALSTLLNAAYMKATVEETYGKAPLIYGIGVDLTPGDEAVAIINPADSSYGFNSSNTNSDIKNAYTYYTQWAAGETVTFTQSGSSGGRPGRPGGSSSSYSWTFDHSFPSSSITTADVTENINYVDTYYPVKSSNLEGVFDQIYEELSSGAFNPISSSTTTAGGTGVQNTPLIYVDFIGEYMEIKEIEAITLFGSSYGVTNNGDGTYTVTEATGHNPTTNEAWNTAEDIKITVTEQADGTQKLEIRINQEILPIILEQVASETVGGETSATITELIQDPIRVYYTVGIDSDILLPNGEVDVTKLQGYSYIDDTNGTVSFYSNQFGVMNPADASGDVYNGDAHVGFKPSSENRYYYHQTNQGIFTKITNKSDGSTVTIPENAEYGIVWDETKYDLHWMTYDEYLAAADTDKVYTYVTYYHPTADTTDAANAAEEVTYLVYTEWGYLKESVAFYDATTETYLNDGAVTTAAEAAAYLQANPTAELYAVLGVGSLRTSRLHNMTVVKGENSTDTAIDRYAPEYTHETATIHNGNDVVVWLGNNGRLTVNIDTGIALTKAVTEAFGDPDDTYSLTVTVPDGVVANPVVVDENGDTVASTYASNVLTVGVKAGQTVYISGIPGGTTCTIGETVNGDYYKVDAKSTTTVTIPTLSQVLDETNPVAQFVPATVTNAPKKYGQLTIVKDIAHDLAEIPDAMAGKVFTFQVQLSPVPAEGKRTFTVDKTNASTFTGDTVTADASGIFTVTLKDNESITVLGLPEDTSYTVTETSTVPGYTNTTGVITDVIDPDGDHDAHFINTYSVTPVKPAVTITGQKILVDDHDTYADDESFTFVLDQYVESTGSYKTLDTQAVKAGKSYTFKLDELLTDPLGLGEHYFRVTEQAGTTAGMSYDATRGLFVVKVTDTDADGTVEYTVENYANTTVTGDSTSGFTVTKDFTNTYDVARTHADINITKTLTNTTGVEIPLDLFQFTLQNTADANDIRTVTTDASGKATIRISDLKQGTYSYTLSEVDGGLAGMDYDETVYTVNIAVDNIDGVLKAVVQTDGITNSDDTLDVSFANTYALEPVKYAISGTKQLDGRDPQDNEFEFFLYETDSSFVIPHGAVPDSTRNIGNTFSFDEITYTQVGTYYYSVKEVVGTVPGVVHYDTTHYHVTVHVGIDSEDATKLAVTQVEINKIGTNSDTSGNVVFVNKYEPTATEYTLSGTKVLHGRAPREGEFYFALYEGSTYLETATIKADGSFAFTPISYTTAGTHTYTIEELLGYVPGVTYTGVNTPITVTVTVTDTDAVLSAQADVENAAIKFENTYTAAPAQVTFNGLKELKKEESETVNGLFTFRLYETDNSFAIDPNKLLAEKQTLEGAFSFERTLSTTGTYFFTIVEDTADPVENVVYDRTQHNFAVAVNDIGDGQLRAAITNVNTGVSTESAAVTAADVTFTNATFSQVTKKEVKAGDTGNIIDGQQVAAGDILTYYITYTNYTGENVVADIIDAIPAHTSYVEGSANPEATYAGGHLNWVLNVAKDETVEVSFQVKVEEAQSIVHNTAVVRDGVNTYYTNEVTNHTVEDPLVKDVFSAADTTQSINGEKVNAGDELLYQITYTNATENAVDVQITDTLSQYVTFVEADSDGVYDNGTITWNLTGISAWDSVTVSFKVTVNDIAEAVIIKNQAAATDGTNNYTSNEVSTPAEPPVVPTTTPTTEPTTEPTTKPTTKPTNEPTTEPTNEPTTEPATAPTSAPTQAPTEAPTAAPTQAPTAAPTQASTGDSTEASGKPTGSDNPKTGDDFHLNLWFMLLTVSFGGFIITTAYSKKAKEAE